MLPKRHDSPRRSPACPCLLEATEATSSQRKLRRLKLESNRWFALSDSHRTGYSGCKITVRRIWGSPEIGPEWRHLSVQSVQYMRFNRPCIRSSCGDETHLQHDRPGDEVCERCQEHGHNEMQWPKPRCKACGCLTHRHARTFECPELKCTQCKGAMGPKGHTVVITTGPRR